MIFPTYRPLFTIAKARDSEIVRALEIHLKGIPLKFKIDFCGRMPLVIQVEYIYNITIIKGFRNIVRLIYQYTSVIV